jgi:hypothetical protein
MLSLVHLLLPRRTALDRGLATPLASRFALNVILNIAADLSQATCDAADLARTRKAPVSNVLTPLLYIADTPSMHFLSHL